ncbi:MAG: DUF7793 family protein [Bacteroidia bacterium]
MTEIDLPYAHLSYSDPIIYITYKKGAQLGFPEIIELISCSEKLSGGKLYVTLSDIREGVELTPEGKRYVSDPNKMPLFRGTAVLVSNNLYKIAVEFAAYFDKNIYPFRAFTSREKAVEWLSTILETADIPKQKNQN